MSWFRNPKLSLILKPSLARQLMKRQALNGPVAKCQASYGPQREGSFTIFHLSFFICHLTAAHLATVAFILFYLGKHPVEFTGRDLAAAEFADAGRVYS